MKTIIEQLVDDVKVALHENGNVYRNVKEVCDRYVRPEKPFPKHMEGYNSGMVVYFIESEKGYMVLKGQTHQWVENQLREWDMKNFKDCEIGITQVRR